MVIHGDIVGIAEIFLVAAALQLMHQFTAYGGVGLHHLKFLRRQPSRLIEDVIGDGDLANIVECRRRGDGADGFFREVIFGVVLRHLLQQHAGKAADTQNVLARLGAAVLDNGGEGIHHHLIGAANGLTLLRHGTLQLPAVEIGVDDDLQTAADHGGLIGLTDHVGHTHGEGQLRLIALPLLVDNGHHGDLLRRTMVAGCHQCRRLRLLRLGDIHHHAGDAGIVLLHQHHGLTDALRLQRVVRITENLPQRGTLHVAAHQQNRIFQSGDHRFAHLSSSFVLVSTSYHRNRPHARAVFFW